MFSMENMDRINRIKEHKLFQQHLQENYTAEANRRFCRHNMVHFLDVARIGWIMNLEEAMGLCKEWIYAAALLHDLGKHVQYEEGTPHELVSAQIAPSILRDCGFEEAETELIVNAIRSHRDKAVKEERSLRGILYRADKASRACFACKASAECNWSAEKKNQMLRY